MHEIIIQICFVVAGMVTGCTDGHIRTDNPYLSNQDFSPVYIYDAPRVVSNFYRWHDSTSITLAVRPRHRVRMVPRHHHHKPNIVVVRPNKHRHSKQKVVIPPNLYKVKKPNKPKVIIKHKKKHKKKRGKSRVIIKSKKKRHQH